jgi:nicotinate-nucleotide adenylyltransferase
VKQASAKSRRTIAPAIALFGGSFDPIHCGHMAVANAALRAFKLQRVFLIPCGAPPHKHNRHLTPYPHRFAMVSIACTERAEFVPSLAEAGDDMSGREIFYSVDTVARFRQESHSDARIYFIMGADQFLEIETWKNYRKLLDSCDFIVANRPGFRLEMLRQVIPPKLFGPGPLGGDRRDRMHPGAIPLRRTAVYPLVTVSSHVSATEIRRRIRLKRKISGLVPPPIEEYIQKQALYR